MYAGSSIKQGEMYAIVYATGVNTFFGKAAHLVTTTENQVTSSLAHTTPPPPFSPSLPGNSLTLLTATPEGTLPSCVKEHRIVLYCDNCNLRSYRTCDTIFRMEGTVC